MTIYITQIHTEPSGSWQYEHITKVKWTQSGTTTTSTRQQMVDKIDGGDKVYVQANPDVPVETVHTATPYIRTVANGTETDNLINLPRF